MILDWLVSDPAPPPHHTPPQPTSREWSLAAEASRGPKNPTVQTVPNTWCRQRLHHRGCVQAPTALGHTGPGRMGNGEWGDLHSASFLKPPVQALGHLPISKGLTRDALEVPPPTGRSLCGTRCKTYPARYFSVHKMSLGGPPGPGREGVNGEWGMGNREVGQVFGSGHCTIRFPPSLQPCRGPQ